MMKNDKEISIDAFTDNEKIIIEQQVKNLIAKSGTTPGEKQLKEFTKEAKKQVMKARLAKEKAAPVKVVRKPRQKSLKASEVNDFDWSASVNARPPRR
ncbi:hypothetical protein J2125_004713 [Erwinia toletana]|uniref:Uncharacterized protein n=1 Tax=Winslowiella toletana TaxID=92490 RepID=A0ABS4PHD4_9GAMM|nr:DUF3811 domain-containing protein [Winslowiella toletana]MBP2171521.1 hypothetical protein [Winslowiella toletana]